MIFVVWNATGAKLATTTSYIAARRRWGRYLTTSPVPSSSAGIDASGHGAMLDVTKLDRWTGYGSPSEREPTEAEVMHATF